ncbi:hypothetical protein MH117_03690 [Paenibacillus sp. ACRRX]|uniref:hypothetical protein n=1 Tax=Paenibacillus sp. ACRRX TaxID=2918206 RepID=UPI001EF74DDA|nr:hypothetical protein [Paenibacillus sp. ACRRX]MCG7406507.1 hypothetical protein [Paenibacillus sp. ACRRX]
MFSYNALPEPIRKRIADKTAELVDDCFFQTYHLHEDPYLVLQWCVASYMDSNKGYKVSLGPYYVGVIGNEDKEASLRRVLTRLYYITEMVTKADELQRLVLLARIHSVTVVADTQVESPYIAAIRTAPRYDFYNTRIVVKVARHDTERLRELVAGNYRGELLHGVLYALLGYKGNEEYRFTRWLSGLGLYTGPEAVYVINGWKQFFMEETVNGTRYLFGIPHSSVPANNKLFTRRALNLKSGQLVREGSMEDIRIFVQMLNLYLGEAVTTWALSNGRVVKERDSSAMYTSADVNGQRLRIVLPADVHSTWVVRHKGETRSLELPHTFPQLGTILFLIVLYGSGLLDTTKGLGEQFIQMKWKVHPENLMKGVGLFVDNNGTRLVQASIEGITYLGMDRYKSTQWYILNLSDRKFVPIEDERHNRIVGVLQNLTVNRSN